MKCHSLLTAALLLCGCQITDDGKNEEYSEKSSEIITLSGESRLIMNHTNGGITITGSDTAQTMVIEMTRRVRSYIRADAGAHIGDIKVSTLRRNGEVVVDVSHPDFNARDYEVDFFIFLPSRFTFDLSLGNGDVTISSTDGDVSIDLGNGRADIRSVTGRLDVELGNGGVEADVFSKDSCSIDIDVENGGIDLTIPASSNAGLHLSAGNGIISTSDLEITGLRATASILSGKLGNGRGGITLTVANGGIELKGI